MRIVPNILSVFRIFLVPVFVVLYFTDSSDIKFYAILVYALAGFSDFLDGYFARRFDAQSKLGKLLDPLGDKLMTFTVMVCITITKPILIWAVLVFFVKEVLMGIGGLLIHKKARIELPAAKLVGKVAAVVFFIVCVSLMLFSDLPLSIANALLSVAICLTLVALAVYLNSYIKIMKSVSKSK